MKYTLTIKVPVYDFECYIVFAEKIEDEINKQLKKLKQAPMQGLVYGLALATDTVHKYHLFYSLERLNVNVLAHEISHLMDYVLQDRGVEPPTDEPRAYLTGYVTEKIFDYVFKNKLLKHKWLSSEEPQKKTKKEK